MWILPLLETLMNFSFEYFIYIYVFSSQGQQLLRISAIIFAQETYSNMKLKYETHSFRNGMFMGTVSTNFPILKKSGSHAV